MSVPPISKHNAKNRIKSCFEKKASRTKKVKVMVYLKFLVTILYWLSTGKLYSLFLVNSKKNLSTMGEIKIVLNKTYVKFLFFFF